LYQVKDESQNARASWIEPNRPGNDGWYLTVLNAASEYGLSLRRADAMRTQHVQIRDLLRGHRRAAVGVWALTEFRER
jgi:hypothetical protein